MDDEQFAELLFEKYEEAMREFHAARRKRYDADLKCLELEENLKILKDRLSWLEARERKPGSVSDLEQSHQN